MLGTHICPVTCVHSNYPHAHVHTCSAHRHTYRTHLGAHVLGTRAWHTHTNPVRTRVHSAHVYTSNTRVHTARTQHTHVTCLVHIFTHMLGTRAHTQRVHTLHTHAQHAHILTHGSADTCTHTRTRTHMLSAHQTPSPCASHNCGVQCRVYLIVRGAPVRWKSVPAFPPQERPAH